jgi:hypothetical protein
MPQIVEEQVRFSSEPSTSHHVEPTLNLEPGKKLGLMVQREEIKVLVRETIRIMEGDLVFEDAFPKDDNNMTVKDVVLRAGEQLQKSELATRIVVDDNTLSKLSVLVSSTFEVFQS